MFGKESKMSTVRQISWLSKKQARKVALGSLNFAVLLLLAASLMLPNQELVHWVFLSIGLISITSYNYWFAYSVSIMGNDVIIENGRKHLRIPRDEVNSIKSVSGFTYTIRFKDGQSFVFNSSPFHLIFGKNQSKAELLEQLVKC